MRTETPPTVKEREAIPTQPVSPPIVWGSDVRLTVLLVQRKKEAREERVLRQQRERERRLQQQREPYGFD